MRRCGLIDDHMELLYCFRLYLSSENTGLAFLCESPEHWQYNDMPIEIIRKGEETVLRLHLLDSEPENWRDIPEKDRLHMDPVTFKLL